jgi:hypothetical protein
MLKQTPGALNGGLNVFLFKKGVIYPNKQVPDLEGLDQIFLDNKFAELYVKPDEVARHEQGLKGAPLNKRETVPNAKVIYTAEELEGSSAKEIRELAEENDVDLKGSRRNTSAETLISMYLERQDN